MTILLPNSITGETTILGPNLRTDDPFFAESLSEWTNNLQPEITKMVESCPLMFDESKLFSEVTSGEDIEAKRLD